MNASLRSLWEATAEPAPETRALDRDERCEVAVVGTGYAGLSTALHLASRGADVVLLEAREIGFGASGRSGGQVIPGIKYDPEAIRRMFGEEAGDRAIALFGSGADTVFGLINRYGIACEATRAGWVQPAHSQAALAAIEARCRQWKDLGADVDLLTQEETRDRLGTSAYHGAWIDRRGGSVQPLSYTRGLARACLGTGVRLYCGSPVERLERTGGGWRAVSSGGHEVTSRRIVLTTNAYSHGLWPGLERSLVAANSFQIATEPLLAEIGSGILKGGIVASDTRRLLAYWRRDRAGRFVLGGRGSFADPTGPQAFRHLERMLARLYPEVARYPIAYRWGGRVAITADSLPHFHEPEPGLTIFVGCQGRGIALQTSMGAWVARYLSSGDPQSLPLPITAIREIPFHFLRRLYIAAMLAYYRAADVVA